MNVIVTGGAGFLGSHLSLYHLRQGDKVIILDNFSSSKRNSPHLDMLKAYQNKNQALIEDVDICDTNALCALHSFKPFDVIYNFACPASPPVYQSMPVETLLTCTLGTRNVFDLATKDHSIVVHASTSEVYGDPTENPQSETYRGNVNSYGPRSCYDEGKRAAEALCFDYLHHRNIDVRLVRIFNTYGPHLDMHDGRVVSNFIRQALNGEDLTIYGEGAQTRSFCYVDDLIRGIVSLSALPGNLNQPINLGNPYEFTVQELADLVLAMIPNSVSRIVREKLPIDDPCQRRPDISVANQILNWEPQIKLIDGLQKTIQYAKNTQ